MLNMHFRAVFLAVLLLALGAFNKANADPVYSFVTINAPVTSSRLADWLLVHEPPGGAQDDTPRLAASIC